MKVYNKSKETVEPAKKRKCPRCKGFGAIVTDRGENCHLCKGIGTLWMVVSGSGWTRAMYAHLEDSVLY